ncbi:ATP-binding protein [Actinomadura meridiana]|uniref:ATP-binding protein n=1 Tax=Actinomadura meridiana TaxID=559626 RepID=A0ABP8CKM4_9ACTN
MSGEQDGDGTAPTAPEEAESAGSVVPLPRSPHSTEILLEVGEAKILQFTRRPPITAIAELVWNALDANATHAVVELRRTSLGAISQIVVSDNGEGITPQQAQRSFREYGDTWKARKTHTTGNQRILHGRMGEGRLYAFALGESFTWDSVSVVDGAPVATRISADVRRPTKWHIDEPVKSGLPTGTVVRIQVPQDKRLRALEAADAAANLTAKLAFYLKAYSDVLVEFDGTRLNPDAIIETSKTLELDLPPEYTGDEVPPFVTFVEWKKRMSDRKMLICNADGIALAEDGEDWSDSVVAFTPYLRSDRFNDLSTEDLHMLAMTHSSLLEAATKAIHKHLRERSAEIAVQVVRQLKDEGIYPYPAKATSATELVEQRTFDVVVTVARNALPTKGTARKLSVDLIRTALERSPSDLHGILESVLALTDEDRNHLSRLLTRTELADVIGAATTVTNRLDFIGALRKILADDQLRKELREVDQLHPMIAQNLWLFGEEWTLARPEVGLTAVLDAHLSLLGPDVVLENKLDTVRRADGTLGRVDILLFRRIGDERSNERIIIELKRPSVIVGPDELQQITSYARAIIDNPQYRDVPSKWQFYLVTYDYSKEILRDIRQKDKAPGLADDQDEYQVWVKSWGEILDAAKRKLSFFRQQLNYEATDERVTQHLRDSYAHYLPEALKEAGRGATNT